MLREPPGPPRLFARRRALAPGPNLQVASLSGAGPGARASPGRLSRESARNSDSESELEPKATITAQPGVTGRVPVTRARRAVTVTVTARVPA